MSETPQRAETAAEGDLGAAKGLQDLTGTYTFGDFLQIAGVNLFRRTFEITSREESFALRVNGAPWGTLLGPVRGTGPWLFQGEGNRFASVGRCDLPLPSPRKLITITFIQYDDERTDPPTTGIWLGTSTSGNTPPPDED